MKIKPDLQNLEFKTPNELYDLIVFVKNEIKEYKKFIRICENWKKRLEELK